MAVLVTGGAGYIGSHMEVRPYGTSPPGAQTTGERVTPRLW
jgi:hypothetical protein